MVSNEDREAVLAKILDVRFVFDPDGVEEPTVSLSRREADLLLAALVSHGWGPKPAVSINRLAEAIAAATDVGPATGYRILTDHLRECGIEVNP